MTTLGDLDHSAPQQEVPRGQKTLRILAAVVAIVIALGGFVALTWYAVSQVLIAPVMNSTQRGIDSITTYAETLPGVDRFVSSSFLAAETTTSQSPNAHAYVTFAMVPGLPQAQVEETADDLITWMSGREENSRVRLHVELLVDTGSIGLSTTDGVTDARFDLLWMGADDSTLSNTRVIWASTPGSVPDDLSNDFLEVQLTPAPGAADSAIRESWEPRLAEIAPDGILTISN
ncbi:MAG TPA: hypothetical protein VGP24_13485 [Glaciihabitans sp.]|jgi:hypothetical protein|nr:hypothetical protein [Glaciihabitans sp.]